MAYIKHNWIEGETITAEKLACIEEGIDCLANCSNVWENPSPESSFPAQEIELDTTPFSDFEFCFIIRDQDKWQTIVERLNRKRAYKSNNQYNFRIKYGNYERYVSIEDSKIVFSDCKYGINYNDKLIPVGIHAFI